MDKITGYRDLTQEDIDRINSLKDKERELVKELRVLSVLDTVDPRCMSLAVTNIQQGFMWAIRAVARPNGE